MNNNVIAIDLAKSSFHACVITDKNKVLTDRSFTRASLTNWLIKQKPATVVMEACGSSHYWARFAEQHGHKAKIIPTKSVTPFRQGHKTDKNDALAIGVASKQPRVKSVAIKTVEQQGLQSIERMRQHLSDQLTAMSNMLRALISEFGITIPKGISAFKKRIPEILEDGENELPFAFREQISNMYQLYLVIEAQEQHIEKQLGLLIKQQAQCQSLMALEGVGPVNALGLYIALGNQGSSFKNGREASACIGLTPKQYSTGGNIVLGTIGKKCGNKRLRSTLIQGALAYVKVVDKRQPKNNKEIWIKQLIAKGSLKKAAVALANKTVRTAWAMLSHDSQYQKPAELHH
ncbi:IS110 family transposase [Thalassotalea sp. LPB0316]|uniref:IS110 family transposase n=1 Tax=Thalassotalea sp. LPB0316 TaxID=2769490 RepID=UPI001866F6B1|nr:IS110 family transposase [Thalassotalea sp. LPB0316]QOL24398.1 IS110 family transposase [Thalassotalea sp. LPB0316]QOL24432.1 IS110 family transposase [Thalassotalea sp. LPB0316]QOL25198.1 IS110 family transposase [Thalassotalea sp. LPB0316]QOL25351.1 IS110 family transposase [Thalassotalea sp. LPB0316]